MVMFWWLLFLIGESVKIGMAQQCRSSNNGVLGVCRRLSQCNSARIALRNRIRPSVCLNDFPLNPVVCCPSTPRRSARISQPAGYPSSISARSSGASTRRRRISEQKCIETYTIDERGGSGGNGKAQIFVIGGEDASSGEFPFMTAIGWKRRDGGVQFNCGGFLVSGLFVVTAAHCTNLGGSAPSVVRTGGNNLNEQSNSKANIPITKIYVHPGYKSQMSYHDIAVLKLSKYSPHTPACLWPLPLGSSFSEVTAIGYGHTQFGGRSSKQLQKVQLKLFSNNDCNRYYSPSYGLQSGIVSSQICAGDLTRNKDTCQGDSGGPILIRRNVQKKVIPYVVGITSFGQGCAGGIPSIYTRVPSYLNWIESVVWSSN